MTLSKIDWHNTLLGWNGTDGYGFVAECQRITVKDNVSHINLTIFENLSENELKEFAQEIADLYHKKYG